MIESKFIAPTEKIELELIEFCIEKLGLNFGEFWYQWFNSNNPNNITIHLDCNNNKLIDKIKKEMCNLSFFNSFHKIDLINMERFNNPEDFSFKYYIHFKKK